ncbi:MAG: hypothetical protein ACKPKO_13805, partial [Candidatus Fonsibacter sp.]
MAMGAKHVDDLTTVTSHRAVGSVADAQPLAGGDPQMAWVAFRSCTQELASHEMLGGVVCVVEIRA